MSKLCLRPESSSVAEFYTSKKLDGENAGVGRHQRERSKAAGRVECGTQYAAVDKPVLLGDVGAEGHFDLDLARRYANQSRADGGHGGLATEAFPDARLKEWVRRHRGAG